VNAIGEHQPPRAKTRLVVYVAVASVGAALIVLAVAANQHWLDRHFVPSFILPRIWYVRVETAVRIALATMGVLLVLGARRIGGLAAANPLRPVQIVIAIVLALAAGELVINRVYDRGGQRHWIDEEPRRQPDPRLGWTFAPARSGRVAIGGRVVDYTLDAEGCRVPRSDESVDPGRPTILFTGESVMFGEGLTWEESIPAQVAGALDIQSANIAVRAYSNGQAYLRLQMMLPRFRRPLALVSIFMTTLFGRNLESERPHFGPGLVWLPPVRRWRLESLLRTLVFYHSEDVIERGVRVTREVLDATAALARTRGAIPLVVIPQFGVEDEAEQALRHRIFDGLDVPFVLVPLDNGWHLPRSGHPDARAAHVIAAAIADRLLGYGIKKRD
jgi:hypothetical protein